ncbi:MAG: SDR family oxidoreductase [Candidatus Binatia bacterium]
MSVSELPVALVTGGGGGIGAACCRALANAGFRIAVHYHRGEAAARALAEELPHAFALGADLTAPAAIDEMIAVLKRDAGRVDVLVNNAGANRNGDIYRMGLGDFDAVAALERGTWYLTKLVLRHFMTRADRGRIINISSVVGHTGNAGQIPYTMAKAGLDALTRSLAKELRGRNILVNSVAPGFIATAMTAELPEPIREQILAQVPLGRMGTPEEVAEVVRFLATGATYVTGSVVHVNGGLYGG